MESDAALETLWEERCGSVRKATKIRNRYNQDSVWKRDKNTRKSYTQESPFPKGDHKAARNRHHSMVNTSDGGIAFSRLTSSTAL